MSTLMRCINRTYRLYGSICTNDECSVAISGGGRFCISNKVACATFNKTLRTWVEVDKCISCKVELQHACIQAQASCKTLYSRCTAARSSWRASARPPERGPALSDRRPCPGQSQQFPHNCSPNGISHLRDACPGHPFVAQGMAMVNTVAALTFKSWGKLAEFTPASCLIWCERPIIMLVYMLMCCKSFVLPEAPFVLHLLVYMAVCQNQCQIQQMIPQRSLGEVKLTPYSIIVNSTYKLWQVHSDTSSINTSSLSCMGQLDSSTKIRLNGICL